MPTISVVTTVYNGAEYVDRAESSILDQTYDDYEWILVDDGSSDDSLSAFEAIEERFDRVSVYSPGRLGRAGALNFGVNKASGEYIAIHDVDDVSYSERLETQIEHFKSNAGVGVAGSYYVLVNEIRNEQFVRKLPTADSEIRQAFARQIPFAHTLTMFRKEAWEAVDGYPIRDNLIDLGLWIDIAAETDWQFSNVPETLGKHYVHDQSFWHQNFEYARRQRDLAGLQQEAIERLNLPRWLYVYVVGRFVYPYFPSDLKRLVRRTVGQSEETDVK